MKNGRVLTKSFVVRIIERTVAVDPACSLITRNDKPPYSKVEEILAALEQSSKLKVPTPSLNPSGNMVVRYTEDTLIHWLI